MALALVLLAIVTFWVIRVYAAATPHDRETIAFAVTTIGAGIAIYGLLRGAESIRAANAEKFKEASLKFVERWNAPGYWSIKAEWRKLNEEMDPLTPQQRNDVLSKDISKRIVAVEILNFYEEMATGVNNGSLNGELLRGYLRGSPEVIQ